MPFKKVRDGASYVWRILKSAVSAFGGFLASIIRGIRTALASAILAIYKAVAFCLSGLVSLLVRFWRGAIAWIGFLLFRLVAYLRRYAVAIIWLVIVAAVAGLVYLFWGDHDLLDWANQNWKDTPNANRYYVVTIIFLPLQTALLLAGGLYAAMTLRQNHRFKQHEVEARCIEDYLKIQERLDDASLDAIKLKTAIRSYWTLMVFEYYWWQKGLLSRELFAIWSQFRVERFHADKAYTFPANPPAEVANYKAGFDFAKGEKVFQPDSPFEKFMRYLIHRSENDFGDLRWTDIERFRIRWLGQRNDF